MSEKCPICKKIFKNTAGVASHIVTVHKIKRDDFEKQGIFITLKRKISKVEKMESRSVNYEHLLYLTKDVPKGLDWNEKKEDISQKIHRKIWGDNNGECYVCGRNGAVEHHRLPNGDADENNLFILCHECHQVVHLLLFIDGKWKKQFIPKVINRVGGW